MQKKVKKEYIEKILAIEKAHIKKYGYRKMNDNELGLLCGIVAK